MIRSRQGGPSPSVGFIVGLEGLSVRTGSPDVAVGHRLGGPSPAQSLRLRKKGLARSRKRHEPVQLATEPRADSLFFSLFGHKQVGGSSCQLERN